jgi:hypothetical protein
MHTYTCRIGIKAREAFFETLSFKVSALRRRHFYGGFRVQGSGFRVQGLGFRVEGLAFRV